MKKAVGNYVTNPRARNDELNRALKLYNDNTLTINGKSINYTELKLKDVMKIYKMKSSNLSGNVYVNAPSNGTKSGNLK